MEAITGLITRRASFSCLPVDGPITERAFKNWGEGRDLEAVVYDSLFQILRYWECTKRKKKEENPAFFNALLLNI